MTLKINLFKYIKPLGFCLILITRVLKRKYIDFMVIVNCTGSVVAHNCEFLILSLNTCCCVLYSFDICSSFLHFLIYKMGNVVLEPHIYITVDVES